MRAKGERLDEKIFGSWLRSREWRWPVEADAAGIPFTFSGPGVSGSLILTYGPATDAKYSNAFEITGISGTFSDFEQWPQHRRCDGRSLGPVNHATPESTNFLAPNDFSKFAVAIGPTAP